MILEERYVEKWSLSVPRLGLGLNRLARMQDEREQEQVTELCMAKGIRYFEVAYSYPGSEDLLNRCIVNNYPRESYFVAEKFPALHLALFNNLTTFDEESFQCIAEKIFEEQLTKTGLEYFDFYLLHHVQKQSIDELERCGVFKFLSSLKRRGLVKKSGFSSHGDIGSNMRLFSMYDWDFVQLAINYMDWENQGAKEQYTFFAEKGIPVNVMCPLAGGNLTKLGEEALTQHGFATPSDFALKWVMSLDNVAVTLSGMTTTGEVCANAQSVETFSPVGESGKLIIDIVKKSLPQYLPCTNCQYCLNACPEKIQIPRILGLYNQFNTFEPYMANTFRNAYYRMLPETRGSKCKACGLCSKICPNHIEIPILLSNFNVDALNIRSTMANPVHDILVSLLKNKKPVIIFGAGSYGAKLKRRLNSLGIEVAAYVDNDPQKWGTLVEKIKVISFKELSDTVRNHIILIAVVDEDFSAAIKKQCDDAGIVAYIC